MSQFINVSIFLINNSIWVSILLQILNLHPINDYKDFHPLMVCELNHDHIFMGVNDYCLNLIIHKVRLNLIIDEILNYCEVIQ